MTTTPQGKRPDSSKAVNLEYKDANGRVIPADHFENEPGPSRPLESFMSKEDVEKFNAKSAAMLRALVAKRS